MTELVYDGSFEGFLSAVFYVYELKLSDVTINKQSSSALFGKTIQVASEEDKAKRVWNGLSKKLTAAGLHSLYSSYLADALKEENNMLEYIRHVFASSHNVENDYSNFAILRAQRVERMVSRERHRMKAFIRFKLTRDNIFFAEIEPDFNVLPLIKDHFEKRYADQKWLIYDLKREYGLYYDLNTVEAITFTFSENSEDGLSPFHESERAYQTLWQRYFKSVNIASRKNMKLHIQHMPKRYWKYLVEKQQ